MSPLSVARAVCRRVARLQSLTVSSLPAVASERPSGEKTTSIDPIAVPLQQAELPAVAGIPEDDVAILMRRCERAAVGREGDRIGIRLYFNALRGARVAVSQSRTTPSAPAVAMVVPSGENATDATPPKELASCRPRDGWPHPRG